MFRSVTLLISTVIAGGIAATEHPTTHHQGPAFRVNSDLVIVPVTVTDRNGHTVLYLRQADFSVGEDGVPQKILSVSRWNAPASIGVILDSSGSMEPSVEIAHAAVRALLSEAAMEDEAFLINFADSPKTEGGFTHNMNEITGKLLSRGAEGWTALVDAIYAGLNRMKSASTARKALVVITDGGENHSRYSFAELLSAARESDTQVYIVTIRRSIRRTDEQRGRLYLDDLAKDTGGHMLVIDSDAQLLAAMTTINELIRNQYLLSYRPLQNLRDGKWHRVRIRLQPSRGGPKYRIYAREGYYAPQQ
jgi:Ca-activated chloride channel homolog